METKIPIELQQIKLQSLLNLLDAKRKRLNQLTSFIYLSPIFYYLVKTGKATEFNLIGFKLNDDLFIPAMFPIFYGVTLLMVLYYGKKSYQIRQSIKKEFGNNVVNRNWLQFLNISSFLDDLMVKFERKKLSSYIFILLLILIFLIIPFIFLIVIIYNQIMSSIEGVNNIFLWVTTIISTWILLGICYYYSTLVSEEQRNKIIKLIKI